MAKKKPKSEPEQTAVPPTAPAPSRSGSRHKPRKMVSLSPRLYGKLKQLARHHDRPVSWQLRIAIEKMLREAGLMTDEEMSSHGEDG